MREPRSGRVTGGLRAVLLVAATCGLWLSPARSAAAGGCPAPASGAQVAVPGRPFAALPSADDCWLFVSLVTAKDHGAVAVLRNRAGQFALDQVVALPRPAYGESFSHDGKVLAVVADKGATVFDVDALEHRAANPLLGALRDGRSSGAVYAAITPDDHLLFVSDEDSNSISVFDLAKARSDGFASRTPLGRVPMARAPVGLAISPDGRWLYATSEVAPARTWRATCVPEQKNGRMHPPGLLFRIAVEVAASDPSHAAVAAFQAGCNPVRVAVSPSGKQVWVTARGDGALLRFEAADLLTNARGAYEKFPVGESPVGLVVRPDGAQVWVALSNRFGGGAAGQLAGVALESNNSSVKLMSAPASGFPREVAFLPDGRTLVATLFDADRIEFMATSR